MKFFGSTSLVTVHGTLRIVAPMQLRVSGRLAWLGETSELRLKITSYLTEIATDNYNNNTLCVSANASPTNHRATRWAPAQNSPSPVTTPVSTHCKCHESTQYQLVSSTSIKSWLVVSSTCQKVTVTFSSVGLRWLQVHWQ